MPPGEPQTEWMTLGEAAEHLRLSRSKLYEMAREGAIQCSKVAGRWRFSRSEIDAWVREQRPQIQRPDEGEGE